MASYNKTILLGNLTADPELRYTGNGTAVCDLRLAVNTKSKDKEETLFIDCTVWDKTAENCAEYLHKGSQVLVEGRLRTDQWEDRDTGKKRSKIAMTANTVQFLGGANEERGSKPQRSNTRGNTRRNSDPVEPEGYGLDGDFNSNDVPF